MKKKDLKPAIEVIEYAESYYLLSNDRMSKPMFVAGRLKLELALEGITEDMIIVTMGNEQRCLIVLDFDSDACWALVQKGNAEIRKLKDVN